MQNEYPPQQVNRFTRFLWWCAGADPYFLLRSPVQDRVKYAGIGGIVFSTGVLATFAGGFAFNTAFGPKGLAGDDMSTIGWTIASAVFGICWGALIFNLDRFIVSSTGKGDGTDSITLKEFGQALPRLIIALILGITISKPLELKIIETEINVELRKKQQEKMDEFNKNTDAKYKQEIALIDADIKKVEDDRGVLVQRQKEAEQEYIDQMQGRAGNAGYGPRAKQLEVLKNEKQKEVEDYDVKHVSELTALKARREEKLSAWENDRNNVNKKQAENLDGLLERISIAHDIGYWLGIALMFIFLSIEMGPIFFKMMMNKGPYDYMVENHNYRMYVQNGIVKEEMIFEGRDGMKLMEKINYLEVENDRKEKVEKLRAQEELNKKIIGVWSQQKMKDIDTDASRFYREDTGGGSNA
ncbi:MAG: hypothetical protein RL213_1934 [Bacteroidota bacterium]|jgi:hypothetical protein